MKPLSPCRLSGQHVRLLQDRLRASDLEECRILGYSPMGAMAAGLMFGDAFAALDTETAQPVGAFGWSVGGIIWSLWTPLTKLQSLQVLRESPNWIAELVRLSGEKRLSNHVLATNKSTLEWLKLTKCFAIDPYPVVLRGEEFNYIETIPAMELN